jgi:hypothetical protein
MFPMGVGAEQFAALAADGAVETLAMSLEEKQARMRTLRRRVFEHDVHAWAGGFLARLASIHVEVRLPGVSKALVVHRVHATPFVSWGSMIHSIPHTDRVAAPSPGVGRRLERLGHGVTAVLRWALRLSGCGRGGPELWMSREWLEEYEGRSRQHPDGA